MTESQQLELFNAPDPSLALVENEHTPKHRAEASAHGLTLLSESVKGAVYRRYEFDACGHIADVQVRNVRDGNFRCQACIDSKHRAEALANGLTLLGRSAKNRHYRRYRFNACGHEDDVTVGEVRKGKFRCQACLNQKLADEAADQGVTLLGESARGYTYRQYELPCGHVADIKTGNLRRGTFACPTCGDHAWTKPSQVYLIKIDPVGKEPFLKFGYAKNVKTRIAEYGLPKDATRKVLKTVSFKTGKEACEFEQTAHHVWKDKKIDPTCSMKSGSTECYPLDWCQTIIEALEAAI